MRRCERSDLYASIQTALDLFFIRVFQQEIDRFFDHLLRFLNRPSVAGHAEFRTRRHKQSSSRSITAVSLGSFSRARLPHERSSDQRGIDANSAFQSPAHQTTKSLNDYALSRQLPTRRLPPIGVSAASGAARKVHKRRCAAPRRCIECRGAWEKSDI
jgi:hypothetical protein